MGTIKRALISLTDKSGIESFAAALADEGIEILTGVDAGQITDDGGFEEGTVNYLVDTRLRELAEMMKKFGGDEGKKKDEQK